jgi:hypothetical protein
MDTFRWFITPNDKNLYGSHTYQLMLNKMQLLPITMGSATHVFQGTPSTLAADVFEAQPETGTTAGPLNTFTRSNPYTRKRVATQNNDVKSAAQEPLYCN